MTLLADYKDKNILVLGAGITGMSCARYLNAKNLSFAINDSRKQPFTDGYNTQEFNKEFPTASLHLGEWNSALIANAEVILISPGIDSSISEISQYISTDCHVMGDVELFCLLNNERLNKPNIQPIKILAVTGSNGKSTVVSLLAYLADHLGVNAKLGGNIGQPVLDIFTKELTGENTDIPEILILELSSFQLETLRSMQAIATSVLNVSDDHLDRHQNMENYQRIKQSIYTQGELAIINRDDKATSTINKLQPVMSIGSDIPEENQFGVKWQQNKAVLAFGEQNLISLEELPLAGMHNALNYLAALALGYSANWPLSAMVKHLSGFTGLAHRCQRVMSNDGITWINDSKATNVGATIAAINGLAKTLTSTNGIKQNLILIAGGDGKGADFTPLITPLSTHVEKVVTLGKDGDKIAQLTTKSHKATSLLAAVTKAKSLASKGDIILLSPACASLDMFKNFNDRGEQFVAAITKVSEAS